MKAVKKPIPIEVVEFDPDDIPNGVQISGNDDPPEAYGVFNQLHSSWIGIKRGDYLNVTDLTDVYPIDRATFERTYTVVDGA